MRIEKERRKVSIACTDGSLVKGIIHINPGERVIDFINDEKEEFIAVTSAEFYNMREVHSFKLFNEMMKNKPAIILNKSAIRLMEEL